jgi:hypothetical protein
MEINRMGGWGRMMFRFSDFLLCRFKRELAADPPKDGSATIFKAEAQRAQSKEFLIKKYSDL